MHYSLNSHIELKVCGMTQASNILAIAELKPTYLGFIFYCKSPRNFTEIIPNLPSKIKKIGVFVNATFSEIKTTIERHNLDGVQLHGTESPTYCKQLKTAFKTLKVIKVFSIKSQFNFDSILAYESACDFYLFDTKGKYPGGNGYTFDWSVLKAYPSTKPYFLSGGIGLDVIDKLKAFLTDEASKFCQVIDVNSAFETEYGIKNPKQLKQFINQLNLKLQ